MDKKVVVGGTLAAILSALGLYAVGKEAAENSAKLAADKPAVEAPADPNAPVVETPEVEEESEGWYDWWTKNYGPGPDEGTPSDTIKKNLGGQ